MRRPTPESETTDSNGNLRTDVPSGRAEAMVRGEVMLSDGSAPPELVEIYGACGEARNIVAVTDAKGRFHFNPAALGDATGSKKCVVRPSLEGYRAESKELTGPGSKSDTKLGKLILTPMSPGVASVTAAADASASKGQRKAYEKALDQAAGQDWPRAIDALQKLTADCPGYSSAWLALGVLRQSRGDRTSAEKAFLEAARTDPKFALPLLRAAEIEAATGDWRSTLEHSQKVIALDPAAFPNAYALNALANLSLQNADAAERSAQAGLRIDTDHQYPELEYALGSVLYSKGELAGAKTHLQAYVDQAPNGPNAAAARNQLADLQTKQPATAPAAQPNRPAAPQPDMGSLRNQNAPLLEKATNFTCLETVARERVDVRGRSHDADTRLVEVAIAGGKEIYSEPDGKRFSTIRASDLLGFSFSTSGLFGSMARAVLAGSNMNIEPAGKETLNGESVLRYNFQTLPGASDWSIQYGKDEGRAGEEGSFFVDSASLTLRRVTVQALNVPREMRLKALAATINYEPETISGRRVLLPDTAEVNVEEHSGIRRVTRISFDHCRGFTAESTVSFDSDSEAAGAAAGGEIRLPDGLDLTVSLSSPVSLASAAATDVITGTAVDPVLLKGREIIARGAAVEGHVRLRRGENAVVLELDRIQTRQGWAPFYGRMVSLNPAAQVRFDAGGSDESAGLNPNVPGVVTLRFNNGSAGLATGTQMVWKTEALHAPVPESHAPQLGTTVFSH